MEHPLFDNSLVVAVSRCDDDGQIAIYVRPLLTPIDVNTMRFKLWVKHFRCEETKEYIVQYSEHDFILGKRIGLYDRDIMDVESLELEIRFEVYECVHMNGNKIYESEWHKYGIIKVLTVLSYVIIYILCVIPMLVYTFCR